MNELRNFVKLFFTEFDCDGDILEREDACEFAHVELLIIRVNLEVEEIVLELRVDDENQGGGETWLTGKTNVLLAVEVRKVDEVVFEAWRFDDEGTDETLLREDGSRVIVHDVVVVDIQESLF